MHLLPVPQDRRNILVQPDWPFIGTAEGLEAGDLLFYLNRAHRYALPNESIQATAQILWQITRYVYSSSIAKANVCLPSPSSE